VHLVISLLVKTTIQYDNILILSLSPRPRGRSQTHEAKARTLETEAKQFWLR